MFWINSIIPKSHLERISPDLLQGPLAAFIEGMRYPKYTYYISGVKPIFRSSQNRELGLVLGLPVALDLVLSLMLGLVHTISPRHHSEIHT